MKTVTEFAALNLKNADKTRQELLAAGKTAEELPAAMGEALKLEGDRLNHLLNALETLGGKVQDLKRAIVLTLAEGEKAPHGAVQKGEHYYFVEYYPPLEKKGGKGRHAGGREERGGRGDRKGKRGGRRGERGERGGRGERSAGGRPGEGGKPGEGRGPRPPRGGRGPRPGGKPSMEAAPNPGTGHKPKVIIVKPGNKPAPETPPSSGGTPAPDTPAGS